jgi:hypothetical protein
MGYVGNKYKKWVVQSPNGAMIAVRYDVYSKSICWGGLRRYMREFERFAAEVIGREYSGVPRRPQKNKVRLSMPCYGLTTFEKRLARSLGWIYTEVRSHGRMMR